MKDIFKNPILYYILIPALVAVWPLLIWAVYLPNTEENSTSLKDQYSSAQVIIQEILRLDPERLEFAGSQNKESKFDYATAIEKVTSSLGISETNYTISSRGARTSGGETSQDAIVKLKEVDIKKSAQFISTLQLHWASLQCTQIKLSKKKDSPDSWDIDLHFKYYY